MVIFRAYVIENVSTNNHRFYDLMISSFLCLLCELCAKLRAQSGSIYLLRQLITSKNRNRHELWPIFQIDSDSLCVGFQVAALRSDNKSQMDVVIVETSSGNSTFFFFYVTRQLLPGLFLHMIINMLPTKKMKRKPQQINISDKWNFLRKETSLNSLVHTLLFCSFSFCFSRHAVM